MARRRMSPEDIAGLMGSPNGPEFDRSLSEREGAWGDDASVEGSAITSITGPSVTFNKEASRTDRPVLNITLNEKYRDVPLNMPKVYGDWKASQKDSAVIPHWHELSQESQADWQQTHPDGKRLTREAIRRVTADPESAFSGEDEAQRFRLHRTRQLVKNMVAEPNSDPSELSPEKPAPLRQMFEGQGTLLTGKYVGGGNSSNNPPENLDPTPEVSLGRAWVANVTSRPEINMALHDDPTHHENMRNAVDSLMQDHAQSVGGVSHGSEVAKHGRLALEAVARSARAHSLGMKATAVANMSQAVRHINDLSQAVKGAKMSAGVPVAATPSPEVMSAGKAYGAYTASVANVKGLPE